MKTIRIRNVPDDVYRTLKMRAGVAGMSLSAYLLRELQRSAERRTIEELIAEIRLADPVEPNEESWAAVRAERDAASDRRLVRQRSLRPSVHELTADGTERSQVRRAGSASAHVRSRCP